MRGAILRPFTDIAGREGGWAGIREAGKRQVDRERMTADLALIFPFVSFFFPSRKDPQSAVLCLCKRV